MALNPIVTSSMVIKGLYESLNLFTKCRRDLDGLVKDKWANSVDVPKNPQLVVRSTGAAIGHADRKKTKNDMSTVNVPFQTRLIQIEEEYESRAETNGDALNAYVSDVVKAYERDFDKLCMNEALNSAVLAGGENLVEIQANELIEKDLNDMKMYFVGKEVDQTNQIVVMSTEIGAQFKELKLVQTAMAYNKDLLEKGVAIIDNVLYVISANLDKVNGNSAMVGFYAKGIAFVIKKYLDRKEVWSTTAATTYIDHLAYVAVKCTKTEFSRVAVLT